MNKLNKLASFSGVQGPVLTIVMPAMPFPSPTPPPSIAS